MMKLPANYNELSQKERTEVRKEYVKRQDGRCCICGQFLSRPPANQILKVHITEALFPQGFFYFPVHLHHNHETGMTIGAVHNRCNAAMWQYLGM